MSRVVAGRTAAGLVAAMVCATAAVALAAPAQAERERPGTGPGLSVPRSVLDAALECTDGGADLDPVLLIPGTGLTPEPNFSWNYAAVFADEGRPFCTVELPSNATGDIQVAAEYVVHALREMGPGTDVVGYSQGGMIGRWALKYWPDTSDLVDDLIGLAPSNHGTLDADVLCLRAGPAGVPCAPAIHQQALAADFIAALNDGPETFEGVDYTVAFTLLDEIVVPNAVPPGSSPLRGGDGEISNIAVQEVCPGHVADHFTIGTFDPVAHAIVDDALDADGPADPARIDRAVCLAPFMPGVDPRTFATDFAGFTAAVGTGVATAPLTPTEPELAPYVG